MAAQACAPGSHSAVWRAGFTVLGGQNLLLEGETYIVDFVSLRRGRVVAHFGFAAEGAPFALERDLVAKVAARAGAG